MTRLREFPKSHTLTRAALMAGMLMLAYFVAVAPWPMVLGVMLAATGFFLYLRIPWLIWVALAFLLPISSGLRIGRGTGTELVLLAAIVIWFATGVVHRRIDMPAKLPTWPLFLYLLVLLTSSLGASDLTEAAAEVLKWVEFGLILVIVPNAVPTRAGKWLATALLLAAVVQAVWGLYQFFLRVGPEWFLIQGRFMRANGFFRQPNPFGGYMGLMLPVAVSLSMWYWYRLWQGVTWRRNTVPLVCSTAATLLIGAALVASWSRGAWLGALAGLICVMAFWNRATLFALVVAITTAALAALAGMANQAWIPDAIMARLRDLPTYLGGVNVLQLEVNDDNFAVIERVAHWVAALRMWERAPWLGIGPGNYAVVYPEVALPRWPDPLGHAHSIYLNVLAETGLLGLISHILLWTALLIWLIRVILKRPIADRPRALAVGVLGMVAHLTVHSIFDNLYVQGMYLVLAYWFATVALCTATPILTPRPVAAHTMLQPKGDA